MVQNSKKQKAIRQPACSGKLADNLLKKLN
jgi:hypothetical protein